MSEKSYVRQECPAYEWKERCRHDGGEILYASCGIILGVLYGRSELLSRVEWHVRKSGLKASGHLQAIVGAPCHPCLPALPHAYQNLKIISATKSKCRGLVNTKRPWRSAMSVEASTVKAAKSTNHKKSRDKSDKKDKKKRKRDQLEDELVEKTPSKKHRSSKTHKDLTTGPSNSTFSDSPNHSPFFTQTSSLYLPLSPISQLHPLPGLCAEHISPLLLTYYPPFHGVILSYSNPRLCNDPQQSDDPGQKTTVLARTIDEYAASFVWVTADFLLFKPQKGGWIEGWVNLQNESHVGLICWNLFNASIGRKHLPKDWKWIGHDAEVKRKTKLKSGYKSPVGRDRRAYNANGIDGSEVQEDEGHFEDATGNRVEACLRFRVKDVETSPSIDREKGFLSIEGTLLSEEEENNVLEQEHIKIHPARPGLLVRAEQPNHVMSGALLNGL